MRDTGKSDYKLFWEAMSGAMAVELVLEEMRLDYQRRPVDMAAGEHKSPEYLAVNPTGQVPALLLPDGQIIGESAAIILTLGDRHPRTGIVPGPDDPERPIFLRWLIYMAASPYMTFVQFNHPERFLANSVTHDALIGNARDRLHDQFAVLENAIMGEPFFLRSGLTALDLYLTMLITFYPDRRELLSDKPRLQRLFDVVCDRRSAAAILPTHLGRMPI